MNLKQIKEKQREKVKQEKLMKEEDYKNNFHPKIKEFLNSEWDRCRSSSNKRSLFIRERINWKNCFNQR